MMKLKEIKNRLKSWDLEVFGQVNLKKKELIDVIDSLDSIEGQNGWNEDMIALRKATKSDLGEICLKEERMAHQKAKITWLKEGDMNSKFFHRILSHRRAKNAIVKLEKENGDLMEEEGVIIGEINKFYKQLFSASNQPARGIEGIEWCPISSLHSELLERSFSLEKIRDAVFDSEGGKSPGPDGFTVLFFQKMWGVIKEDLCKVLEEFYHNGVINGSNNETFICLIPKKSNSCKVTNFRPISLVTSLYKIISKVLASRLRNVLHTTIDAAQFAFV